MIETQRSRRLLFSINIDWHLAYMTNVTIPFEDIFVIHLANGCLQYSRSASRVKIFRLLWIFQVMLSSLLFYPLKISGVGKCTFLMPFFLSCLASVTSMLYVVTNPIGIGVFFACVSVIFTLTLATMNMVAIFHTAHSVELFDGFFKFALGTSFLEHKKRLLDNDFRLFISFLPAGFATWSKSIGSHFHFVEFTERLANVTGCAKFCGDRFLSSVIECFHSFVSPIQILSLDGAGVSSTRVIEKFTSALYHKTAPEATSCLLKEVI